MEGTIGITPILARPKTTPGSQPQADGRERRVHDRRELAVEVGLLADCQFYTGFAQNISSGGIFIATHDALPVGSRLEVAFRIPDVDHGFETTVEVRWVRTYDGGQLNDLSPGMGLRFLKLSPMEQELINQFISGTDTIFFEDE